MSCAADVTRDDGEKTRDTGTGDDLQGKHERCHGPPSQTLPPVSGGSAPPLDAAPAPPPNAPLSEDGAPQRPP